MVDTWEDIRKSIDEITDLEHEGDTITHQIMEQLNRTFVTPFDREDIVLLAQSLDDVTDFIYAAATRMFIYKIDHPTSKAKELAGEMAKIPGDKPLVMVNNWSLGSRLAWYSYPERFIVNDTRFDQFDIWYGGPEKVSRGIMVVPAYFKHPPTLKTKSHFCEQTDSLAIKHHGHTQVTYYFYTCAKAG